MNARNARFESLIKASNRTRRDAIDVSAVEGYMHLRGHLDADTNIIFARELLYISARTMFVQYAELMIRKIVPVSHEVDPGSETFGFHQFDQVGVAKLITDYGDDLPRADVFGKEYIVPVREFGNSYGWSLRELEAAAKANRPLMDMRAMAQRRSFEQFIDQIGTSGDTNSGLGGFLTNPNATLYTVPNGVSTHPDWARKNQNEIIADITGITSTVNTTTLGVEKPDTLLLPLAQYNLIANTPRSDLSDTTILKFVLDNNPFLKEIAPWTKLAGAGASGKDRMVAYTRDPEKLELHIPLELQQLPPQPRNLGFKVPCRGKIAGTVFYYPLSQAYGDGI